MRLCVRLRPLLGAPGPGALEYDKTAHALRVATQPRATAVALPPRVAFLDDTVTDDHVFHAHAPPGLRALVVYGQTGSGKTHTLEHAMRRHVARALRARPLALAVIEIYNEKVWDILAPRTPRALKLCDNATEPCRTPPTRQRINSVEAFDQQLRLVAHLRFQGASRLNAQSSRSHMVYRICDGEAVTTFVDLAGNEKGRHSLCHREAAHINQSLFAFKECLRRRAAGAAHVPYRRSQLTRVLRPLLQAPAGHALFVPRCTPARRA